MKDLSLEIKNTPYCPAQWSKQRHDQAQGSENLKNQKHMEML